MKQHMKELQEKLTQKEEKLTAIHQVITPDSGISPEIQAQWMIQLLQAVYTEHGIAKDPQRVIQSIADKTCRCWFVLENGQPVAISALIQQADGSVELGRAVALTPGLGLGSIVMLRAGIEHLSRTAAPLVAEVRVADSFLGVTSGMATQQIMFGLLRLTPHAIGPLFKHGNPMRNEMFVLGSTQAIQRSEPVVIPHNTKVLEALRGSLQLGKNLFQAQVQQRTSASGITRFTEVQSTPFSVIVPTREGKKLDEVEDSAWKANSFALLPVETSVENVTLLTTCLEAGWIPCGVDRTLSEKGHQVILFGKVRESTLLAPTRIRQDVFSQTDRKTLEIIAKKFA